MGPGTLIAVLIILLFIVSRAIRILKEYERAVVFRLGRLHGVKGPGLIFVIPIIDKINIVSLRTFVIDVPPQEIITKDNVPVKVNAVVYARVFDPEKAVCKVEDYMYATSQIAQTTLRAVIGKAELDEVLAEREKINQVLQEQIDLATDPWGIKVSAVEIKDVQIPEEMYRAMARAAEAERDRRARIITAEAEVQAAQRLRQAAEILGVDAASLRYLQTISEVAAEKNVTIVIPMEFLRIFRNLK